MSIINVGQQTIGWDFKHQLKGSKFNTILKGLIKPGIYSGGALSIDTGNEIEIAPFKAAFTTDTDKIVMIDTASVVPLTLSETNCLVYATYSWQDVVENWLDFAVRDPLGAPVLNEIVFGVGIYVGGVLTSFDYTLKTRGEDLERINQLNSKATISSTDIFPIQDSSGDAWYTTWINTLASIKTSIVDLFLTASPAADITASGTKIDFIAGASFTFGQVGKQNSNGKITLAQGNLYANTPAICMALESGVDTESISFLLNGIVRNDAWNWTVGGYIYLSTSTAGAMTQTLPSTIGNQVQLLGIATHADRMLFNPQIIVIEV